MRSVGTAALSRRRLLAQFGAVTTATSGLIPMSGVAQSSATTNWPMHRSTATNAGTGSSVVPTESIQERWQFTVQAESFSAPAVVDGTAYVGSTSNSVYALDTATGNPRWQFRTDNSIYSTPAVADGTVYVSSTDSNVYALSTDDGSERWSTSLGLPIGASPTPVGDSVYIGGRNGRVSGLNATTGEVQWEFNTEGPIYGAPAVVDGNVYAANEAGMVFALDAEDGRRYWQTQVLNGFRSSPVVADGTLYLTSENDRVIALTAQFGEQQWSKNIPIQSPASLAVTDSILAVPGGDGTLYILDPDTGTERYQFDAGARCYSPVLSEDVLCVGISGGVRTIEPTTSAQQWSYTLSPSAHPALSVSNGVVYAAGENGTLYAIVGDETPTPGTDSADTSTQTPTPTTTPTPAPTDSRSDSDSTPTETPVSTSLATGTATPAMSTEPSQLSMVRENRTLLAGIGSVVLGSVLLASYLGLRNGSASDTVGATTESRDTHDTGDVGTDRDVEDVTSDMEPDELVEEATQAFEQGQRAKDQGEYGRAATQLEDAVEGFNQALSAVDDDQAPEIRDELEAAKAALLSVDSPRQALDDVQELLGAAESDMENAIVAFVSDQQTVARVRFRQARDRYEQAVDLLEDEGIEQLELSVEVSTDEALDEVDTFDRILGVDAETIEALREAGYDMPTDLQGLPIDELARTADVDDETAARLKVASWHTPSNQRLFTSADDVTSRLEAATLGYRTC